MLQACEADDIIELPQAAADVQALRSSTVKSMTVGFFGAQAVVEGLVVGKAGTKFPWQQKPGRSRAVINASTRLVPVCPDRPKIIVLGALQLEIMESSDSVVTLRSRLCRSRGMSFWLLHQMEWAKQSSVVWRKVCDSSD